MQNKVKKGFTIIEVVLVLAIAGLIFLMVFLALPALQRSQRDTQRDNDLARLQTSLINYKTNNRNKLPGGRDNTINTTSAKSYCRYWKTTANATAGTTSTAKANCEAGDVGNVTLSSGDWADFYDGYLLAGNDVFNDPSGSPYVLNVVKYNSTAITGTGATCNGQPVVAGQNDTAETCTVSNENGGNGAGFVASTPDVPVTTMSANNDNTIYVVTGATCEGESLKAANGSQMAAMYYKRESGGTKCLNT